MTINKVGVVGCGQMGSSITLLAAQAGYRTIVSELNEGLLKKGLQEINSLLQRGISKGKLLKSEEHNIRQNLRGTTNISDFSDCDLVIEAVVENIEEKKKVFAQLESVCPSRTIFTSNTFSLPINDMAMVTKRPDKIIGMRFFYPVMVMTLLEIVTTTLSSKETIAHIKTFGESLGKSIIITKDEPGFIVNRLVAPFLLDAIRMLESGMASKEDIDASMVLGLNHPMGPLRLVDLIGLDNVLYVTQSIHEQLKEEKFSPPQMLKDMVMAGYLGRKTLKGFYEY